MAVYEHAYRRYTGALTPQWSRFLVIPRHALREVFRSRFFLAFFVACFFLPVGIALFLYLRHNVSALEALQVMGIPSLPPVGDGLFLFFARFQGVLAGLLTLFVGPALVSPDLRNNALPLYLGRPFTRTDYVLGKMVVLALPLSAITWVPGLVLFSLQSFLEGWGWLREYLWVAVALFLAFWIEILVLSLMSLAISAWVKWRPVASAALVGIFLVLGGLGGIVNGLFRTWLGHLIDLGVLMVTVWQALFRRDALTEVPVPLAWLMLLAACGLSLLLLYRKVQAYEVVK